jgi:hypothetical protein
MTSWWPYRSRAARALGRRRVGSVSSCRNRKKDRARAGFRRAIKVEGMRERKNCERFIIILASQSKIGRHERRKRQGLQTDLERNDVPFSIPLLDQGLEYLGNWIHRESQPSIFNVRINDARSVSRLNLVFCLPKASPFNVRRHLTDIWPSYSSSIEAYHLILRQEEIRHRRGEIEQPLPPNSLNPTHDLAHTLQQPQILVHRHKRHRQQRLILLGLVMACQNRQEAFQFGRVD